MKFPPIRLQQAWNFGGLSLRELAVRTWKRTQDHELMTRAAGVAFYAMLALVPFLALVITLAIQALPDLRSGAQGAGDVTVEEFRRMLRTAVPAESYELVEGQIARIQEQGAPVGFLAFGLLVTIWLASSLFVAVIDAMNAVYGVKETRPFWKLRLTALVMTLIQVVILLAALISIAAWPVIMNWLGLGGAAAAFAAAINWVILFVMLLMSFALTFYVAPNVDQRWEWITPGSVLGTVAFVVASYGIRFYLQNFGNYEKSYGSLGGVMALLFWMWVASLIVLVSGQMNKVIEDAASLGRGEGQAQDVSQPPDWTRVEPTLLAEVNPAEARR